MKLGNTRRLTAVHAHSSRASARWAVTPFAISLTAIRAAVGLWTGCIKFPPLQGPCALTDAEQHLVSAAFQGRSSAASAR